MTRSDLLPRDPSRCRVLLTGASGTLGRILAPALAAAGYRLRLSDIVPFPDPMPAGAEFVAADLGDAEAVARATEDMTDIVHFGGINGERDVAAIMRVNILGANHVFEAARKVGARVTYASSNHAIGFYRRGESVTTEDPFRPDSHYGLSKAYAETLGRLFFDKYGVENIHLRIGSCLPRPTEPRHLSTWLSPADLVRLVLACLKAPDPGFAVAWGISRNDRAWWRGGDGERIGYVPRDEAEAFAAEVGPATDDPIAARYQGGAFCSQ